MTLLDLYMASPPARFRSRCAAPPSPRARARFRATCRDTRWRWFAALWLALPWVAGCSGCNLGRAPVDPETEAANKAAAEKAKREAELPDFDQLVLEVQPGRRRENARLTTGVKPGHWFNATAAIKANHFDFQANVKAKMIAGHSPDHPAFELEHLPYRLTTARAVSLPKGQRKEFELPLFLPRSVDPSRSTKTSLDIRLTSRRHGGEYSLDTTPLEVFQPFQYYFLVLARDELAYDAGIFTNPRKQLYSFRTLDASSTEFAPRYTEAYRVVVPHLGPSIPIPSHPLFWTSIAYVLWDDLDPSLLSAEQQVALLDWLHWGGQLIISGPASLETLKSSFLADYLPAQAGPTKVFPPEALNEWNRAFCQTMPPKLQVPLRFNSAKLPPIIELLPQPFAEWIPGAGQMIIERRLGRGRIVATAFSLANSEIRSWRHFDNVFNNCLLRRPPRFFSIREVEAGSQIEFQNLPGMATDSRAFTGVRYFTRDAGSEFAQSPSANSEPVALGAGEKSIVDWRFAGFQSDRDSGVAGWSDSSGAASLARDSLRSSASVTIPSARFVLEMTGLYLLILVPLNWCAFKLLGRVEWAWIAAPFIALLGAVFVVRMAQLDVGFARSRTEVAVLELHGGYPRSHLTRYVALYNSLSTTYRVDLEDPGALALPFAADPDYRRRPRQSLFECRYLGDQGVALEGLFVPSNATGMLHVEQCLSLSGPLALQGGVREGWRLENNSQLNLRSAAVLRRSVRSGIPREWEAAWIGDLSAKSNAQLNFRPSSPEFNLESWRSNPELGSAAESARPGQFTLEQLLRLARLQVPLAHGDARLIAFTDEPLPGMQLSPNPSQAQQRTIVVAHLAFGALPAVASDQNTVDPSSMTPDSDLLEPADEK